MSDETQALMAELSNLQSWCALMSRKDSGGMAACDLIQRARVHIMELVKVRDFYADRHCGRGGADCQAKLADVKFKATP